MGISQVSPSGSTAHTAVEVSEMPLSRLSEFAPDRESVYLERKGTTTRLVAEADPRP